MTHYYVPTDLIIIRVTKHGFPASGIRVVLIHEFKGNTMSIPGNGYCFYTDNSGQVVIHLGGVTYYDKCAPYEPHYWIYINGQNTSKKITSTASGKIWSIDIELEEAN